MALQGARLGGRPGHEGGKLSPQHCKMGLKDNLESIVPNGRNFGHPQRWWRGEAEATPREAGAERGTCLQILKQPVSPAEVISALEKATDSSRAWGHQEC